MSGRLAKAAALLAVMSSCLGGCGETSPSAAPGDDAEVFASAADADTFYSAPAMMPNVPGTIIDSRASTFQPGGVPEPSPAWQLKYVTRDVAGRAIIAVATVVKPLVPNLYGHPVLVSFQHAYDSLGAGCTPSHTDAGSTSNTTNMAETLEYLPGLQALGWTMVIPDYEALQSAFGAGVLSGQATLDAVRAALRFEPLGLAPDTPVALWGYSGGSLASTWAAALQPSYAQELNLVAVAAGGTPANLFELMRGMDNTANVPLMLSLIFGVTRAYPDFLPAALLTDKGRQTLAAMKDGCESHTTDGSPAPEGPLSDFIAASDPFLTPGFVATSSRLTLLQSPLHPAADVYLFHEIHDELVPIEGADQLVAQWCAAGTPLTYYRSNAGTAGGEVPAVGVHVAGAALGTPAVIAYLNGRFSGISTPVTPPGSVRCN